MHMYAISDTAIDLFTLLMTYYKKRYEAIKLNEREMFEYLLLEEQGGF